jgi:DNA-binding protein YbaB
MAGQVERAQQEIVAAQTRIAELTGSIGTLTHQAGQAQAAAAAKRQELELMESNFKLAANAVRAELQGNKAAVASALG